jgi:FG-GAP repeat
MRMSLPVSSLLLACLLAVPALGQQTEAAKLVPEPEVDTGQWGGRVEIDGDWLFVGSGGIAPASLYQRTNGGWAFRQFIRGDLAGGNYLSANADFDGVQLVVGAPLHGINGGAGLARGQVQIFELKDGWWELEQTLNRPSNSPNHQWFGADVSISGSTLVVGVPGSDKPVVIAGEVLIFERLDGVWVEVTSFFQAESPDLETHMNMGVSVATNGDTIVAGASGNGGAFYVFERGPEGWVRSALVPRPANAPNWPGDFARNVVLSADGKTIVATEAGPKSGGLSYPPGQAFIFESNTDGSWGLVQTIRASDGFWGEDSPEGFGSSVALEGGTLAVGAYNGVGGGKGDGALYLFHERNDGSWPSTEDARLIRSGGGSNGSLGGSVALSGGFLVSGSAWDPPDGFFGQGGAAYVFELEEGAPFCPTEDNSIGLPARLVAVQSGSADGELVLSVRDCPAGEVGFFLASLTRLTPMAFDGGVLCLGPGPILRSAPVLTGDKGAAMLDLNPPGESWEGFSPGTSVYFQFQFKDAAGLTGANLSNALAITLR